MNKPILLEGTGGQFIVGLHWTFVYPAPGSDGTKEARKVATEAKASHLVLEKSGDVVRTAGLCNLGRKPPAKVYSLAAAFAQKFNARDRALVVLNLPGESTEPRVWICAVSEGSITKDVVVNRDQVRAVVQDILGRYDEGAVTLHGDVLDIAAAMSLDSIMDEAFVHVAECKLQGVGRSISIPKPVAVALAATLVLILGKTAVTKYEEHRAAVARATELANRAPEITPQEAWKQGVDQWVAKSEVAGPSSLSDLLGVVGRLGLDVADSKLTAVKCKRTGPQWSCEAALHRDADRRATASEFEKTLPPGFSATWVTIDDVLVRFAVPIAVAKFDPAKAPKEAELRLPLLSQLQRYSKAFTTITLGGFAAVPIEVPKRADNTAYVIDPSTVKPLIVNAKLEVSGPLRSAFVLLDLPISFTEISLKVGSEPEPSLSKSGLQLEVLKGEIYAIR